MKKKYVFIYIKENFKKYFYSYKRKIFEIKKYFYSYKYKFEKKKKKKNKNLK